VVGLTATPFRGTGEWLTSGEDALFGGVEDIEERLYDLATRGGSRY
jgi:superfamily II DNA or RNA helicase